MSSSDEFNVHNRFRLALGLGLVYSGLCLAVLNVMWMFLGPMIMLRMQVNLLEFLKMHAAICGGAFLTATLLGIAGRVLCLTGPRRKVGMIFVGAVWAALLLDLLGIIVFALTVLHFFTNQFAFIKDVNNWSVTLSLVGHSCFLAFLWRLAVVIGRKGISILAIVAAVSFIAFVGLFQFWIMQRVDLLVANLQFERVLTVAIVGLVALVCYGNVLSYLRRAVSDVSVDSGDET